MYDQYLDQSENCLWNPYVLSSQNDPGVTVSICTILFQSYNQMEPHRREKDCICQQLQ